MSANFITPVYHPLPALLAAGLAWLCAYVTLDLGKRMRNRDEPVVRGWWIGGSLTLGTGYWAVHMVVVTSIDLGLPLGYDYMMAFLSWLGGAAAAALILHTARANPLPRATWAKNTLGVVLAITLMHRAALNALHLDPGLERLPLGMLVGAVLALATAAHILYSVCDLALYKKQVPLLETRQFRHSLAQTALVSALYVCALLTLRFPHSTVSESAAELSCVTLGVVAGISAFILVALSLLSSRLAARSIQRSRVLKESLMAANRELLLAVQSDNITHLPNRIVFEDRLYVATQQADSQAQKIAVLSIDLDGFRAVNESFGHATGDALLLETAKRLKLLCRPTDTLARVGSDEFLMLLEGGVDVASTADLAQRILDGIASVFHVGSHEIRLSGTVGIVFYPDHGPRSRLISNANAAIAAAKRAGGGLHCFFEPSMADDSAHDHIELQRDLRLAIERNELMLYYQPKINAQTNQITGAEALLRWRHPQRGMVSPTVFIPIAERFGLISTLGHWVIEESCRQLREWIDQGLRIHLAINLSAYQLRQVDFVRRIREVFMRYRIDPSLITFEITESVAMEDTQATMHAFERLASAGVMLSIDDFGTGYSSLSYLRKLPAKQLKIDRSFIQDLGQSADAKAIVQAVIQLSHALGLSVVAEGVETALQQSMLQELGCDELQGFLFAKPMSATQLTLWALGNDRPEAAESAGIRFSNSSYGPYPSEVPAPEFGPTSPAPIIKH